MVYTLPSGNLKKRLITLTRRDWNLTGIRLTPKVGVEDKSNSSAAGLPGALEAVALLMQV